MGKLKDECIKAQDKHAEMPEDNQGKRWDAQIEIDKCLFDIILSHKREADLKLAMVIVALIALNLLEILTFLIWR